MLTRLIAALWLGSAFFLMLAASAAFRAAPNSTTAADVVGAMLNRWHYIALAAPLILFGLELRHARKVVLIALFVAIVLAAAQAFVDLRIRTIRNTSVTPISELAKDDPVRRKFGALHGVSMLLLLLQTISAAVVVASEGERPARPDGASRAVVDRRAGGPPEAAGTAALLGDRHHVPVDVHLADRQAESPERVADLARVADDHDQ